MQSTTKKLQLGRAHDVKLSIARGNPSSSSSLFSFSFISSFSSFLFLPNFILLFDLFLFSFLVFLLLGLGHEVARDGVQKMEGRRSKKGVLKSQFFQILIEFPCLELQIKPVHKLGTITGRLYTKKGG